jgi:hypothetical protein
MCENRLRALGMARACGFRLYAVRPKQRLSVYECVRLPMALWLHVSPNGTIRHIPFRGSFSICYTNS